MVKIYTSGGPPGVTFLSLDDESDVSPTDESFADKPEQGIFWGPKQPNGSHTRWSKVWFDWRNEQRSRA
jgi:hypothetical protein